MPRIQPIPLEHFDAHTRADLERIVAEHRASSHTFLRILGYHPAYFQQTVAGLQQRGGEGLLGSRLQELIRLRSAQIGGCDECSRARYSDAVSEADVACVVAGGDGDLSERERLALRYVTLMHTDHHRVDDAFFRELAQHFTTAEIIELAMLTATLLGYHRFLHALDILGTDAPVIPFDPTQIAASHEEASQ
jgi:alkylhydroperoxidase family enzyme